jgi:phosphatidylglycerophosphatase C
MAAVSPAGVSRDVVAAFDVDGTLTTHDCVVPFLRRVAGTARLAAGLAARPHRLVPALVRRDRDALKALSADVVFRGRSVAAVAAEATEFAQAVHRDRLRPDTVATLRRHQADGHTVVLVSASFAVYLHPLARLLGVDHVVATELETDQSGARYTGALEGPNCRAHEKVVRLHRWLDERDSSRARVELWAYGDSSGDRELLADADHGVWVAGAAAAA